MGNRILIVDDEPNIVTSLEFLMRECGCEVRVARNGNDALQLADNFQPNVVLLDVMLPQQSGLEVCRKIRENPSLREMKIVVLTARGGDAERDRGLSLGANAYVTKPFSTQDLVNTVRGLLRPAARPGEEVPSR